MNPNCHQPYLPTVPTEADMPYPRICAHRGFNTVAPENSMPAFGAAVALGAQEIEFDIWSTLDGVLVSCHDDTLERVSNGTGKIYEKTYAQLLELDFGAGHDPHFAGLKIPTLEQILQRFSRLAVINLHVKIWHFPQLDRLEQIVALIRKYDAQDHIYIMTSVDPMIPKIQALAPDIPCCLGWDNNPDPLSMVERAIRLKVKKIQLFKPYFTAETVAKAHENGIRCNVFWADDPAEALQYLEMGIDTILTNDYLAVSQIL